MESDLLGRSNVKTTQRYCRVSNLNVQRDYFNAMEVIMQRRVGNPHNVLLTFPIFPIDNHYDIPDNDNVKM